LAAIAEQTACCPLACAPQYPNGILSNAGLVERTGSQAVILPGLNIYETTDRFLFRDALRTAELALVMESLIPFN
jgi:hypothetical protein